MKIVGYSNKGLIRENNEDVFLIGSKVYNSDNVFSNDEKLLAVFDGVGGLEKGEVASSLAANYFGNQINSLKEINELTIQEAIYNTNNEVLTLQELLKTQVATTISGLYFADNNLLYTYNLGDSQVFRFRSTLLVKLTEVNTLANDLNSKNINHHHVLTKYLGKNDLNFTDILVEKHFLGYKKNDLFLICSDGITDMIDDLVLEDMFNEFKDLLVLKEEIVKLVIKNGAKDNFTLILVEV